MKTYPVKVRRQAIASALAGLCLAASSLETRAADVVAFQFNTATEVGRWRFDFGSSGVTNSFSYSTDDANGNTASGSMKLTVGYGPSFQQAAFTAELSSPTNGTKFTGLEFDVKVDAASALDKFGNALYFQLVARNGAGYSYNKQFQGNLTVVSTNNGWRHVVFSPLVGAVDDIRALTLDLYDNNYTNNGVAVIYVDNIKFTKPAEVTDIFLNQFVDDTEVARWRFDYGTTGITNALAFSTNDVSGDPASGSLQVQIGYGPSFPQAAFTRNVSPAVDASSYSSLEMDVKVDPASALDRFGNATFFQVALRVGGGFSYNKQFQGNISIVPTNNGWIHIATSPLVGVVDDIRGITLDPYNSNYTNFNGLTTFYLDNLKFTQPITTQGPPPPKLSAEKAIPGLNLIPLGTFNRENIALISDQGTGFYGSANPVTYAVTISAYADAAHSGLQTHIILDAAGGAGPDTYADYSRTNIIFLDIQNQANGATFAALRYKTNEPAGNTFLYGAGTLGGVSSPTAVGTWSLTISQNTNLTVTAPGGGTFATNIPPTVAAMFADPLRIYLGAQAHNNNAVGQSVVVSRFQVKNGNTVVVDDSFASGASLDTATWQVAAVDAASVRHLSSEAALWVGWTLPAVGFVLQSNPGNLADANAWTDSTLVSTAFGSVRKVLLLQSDLPNEGRGFFRLAGTAATP